MELRSVIARLQALSRRLLLRILLTGAPRLVAAACALAGMALLLDYTMRLPVPVRAVLLVLSLGGLGLLLVRHLLRPLMARPTIDQLALMAEEADPNLKDQVISSIQLERDLAAGRAVESPDLIRATIADTAQRFSSHSFTRSVSLRACRKPALLATAAVLLFGGFGIAYPETFALWARRQLLLANEPWPREHTLEVTIVDMERFDPAYEQGGQRVILHVPERTPLQVQVFEKSGKLPDEVDLVVSQLDGEDEQHISMGRTQKNDYFQHIFPPLMRSIVLHAEGGDDDDGVPQYVIHVDQAPRVTRFWADYRYPSYTGLRDRSLPDANISAPEGTRIIMHFEVNMPLEDFRLEVESADVIAMPAGPKGNYVHSFVVESNDFYTYRLKGDNGVQSADVPRYVITAEVDQAPRVNVEMPAATTLFATPNATAPLKGVAVDDYGVTAVGLRWGENPKHLEDGAVEFAGTDLVDAQLGEPRVAFFHSLEMKSVVLPAREAQGDNPARPERSVQVGDRFAFRFLAADNRKTSSQPEPHRTFGDYEYHVQVLSGEDLQRELAQRQVRLRTRVRDIAALVETRMTDTQELIEAVKEGGDDATKIQARLWGVEQDQHRISIELQATARQFMRVYDGYLWNRLDEGALTEKVIGLLSQAYRSGEAEDVFQVYGNAVEQVRPLVDDSTIIGRLTGILELMIRSGAERSPEARRRLQRASLVAIKDARVEQLEGAYEIQKLLHGDVMLLIEKLEAWEDYLDVIQGFKDLLEMQKGIHTDIKKLTKKK
jgi:hypothetical protein